MPGRRRLRVRARAAVASALISLLLAGALTALSYAVVRRSLLGSRERVATTQTYTDARLIRTRLRLEDASVTDAIQALQTDATTRVVIRYGPSWYGSSVGTGRAAIPASLREGVEAGRAGHQTTRVGDRTFIAVGVPIRAIDAAYFEFIDLSDIESTLESLSFRLAVAGAVAALLAAGAGIATSARVLAPLRNMAEVARTIAGGDLESRLDAGDDADLGPLVDSFNEMLDHLRDRIDREARFASDVSHELRGPLAVLSSAVEVVNRRRSELPERAVEAMTALESQVRAFNQLVLDLLEISRFDAGAAHLEVRRVDLEVLLRAVVEERPEHPRVQVESDGHPLLIELDPRRIHQVFANLLDNAANYAGGATAVGVAREDGDLVVTVDDAGPGIAESERQAVFDRFHRGAAAAAPGAPRGTGLGLALVAEHVRLHHGSVSVGESPDGGARFTVRLPAAPR